MDAAVTRFSVSVGSSNPLRLNHPPTSEISSPLFPMAETTCRPINSSVFLSINKGMWNVPHLRPTRFSNRSCTSDEARIIPLMIWFRVSPLMISSTISSWMISMAPLKLRFPFFPLPLLLPLFLPICCNNLFWIVPLWGEKK